MRRGPATDREFMSKWVGQGIASYVLSLPERVLRSTTAIAGGLVHEIGEITVPRALQRTRLYQNMVAVTLRFLVEKVGEVEGVFPGEADLSEDFLVRRTAGNGIELMGVLAFHASPVWVLAALADASGAGRLLIREIADSLKKEGLLDAGSSFSTVDEMLDGLEASAGRIAETINTPPLDVATLRKDWEAMRSDLARIPPRNLPSLPSLRQLWDGIEREANEQKRTVFQVSSLMAVSAVADLPRKARWLSASTRLAVGKTGSLMSDALLEHYRTTLVQIRHEGYLPYAARQFRPYLYAAALQFSPKHSSLTERMVRRITKRK
jgi:hypothetical protein